MVPRLPSLIFFSSSCDANTRAEWVLCCPFWMDTIDGPAGGQTGEARYHNCKFNVALVPVPKT